MTKYLPILVGVILSLSVFQQCKHSIPDPMVSDLDTSRQDTTTNDTTTQAGRPCDKDSVYYARDIQPIFNAFCLGSGCHYGPRPAEGFDLTTYLNAMASGKIKPYNSGGSDVYEVLNETDPNKLMPPSGKLPQDKIDLIKKWIDQGAKELWCDDIGKPCDTVNVTYSKTVVTILGAYGCISCHGASGGVTVSNYAGLKQVVDNGKFWNSINHTTVDKFKMPNTVTKISDCELKQIKIWIDAGAPQN